MMTRKRQRIGLLILPPALALLAGVWMVMLLGCSSGGLVPVPVPPDQCEPDSLPRINAPQFSGAIPFEQTAIAWFGQVTPTRNYADIRVGYNMGELYVYVAVFDRHLWYDENPQAETLTQWDAVTLLIDTSAGEGMSNSCWRFVAQLYGDPDDRYKAAYRGSPTGWQRVSVPFRAVPGWRGNALNNEEDTDRGWAMGFTIPFRSLDAPPPTEGTTWRLAVLLHDRDNPRIPPTSIQAWPPSATQNSPVCWGFLRFGLPTYQVAAQPTGNVMIRRPQQNSPLVPDADVGGTIANQCPGDEFHIWNQWGNRNDGKAGDVNIQNQSDVADWPCFAKYYVTFPLDNIPPGKTIVRARLTLYQFGNSGGPGQARPSWVQVLIASADWREDTITWNNAPLAYENIGGSWVEPLAQHPGWPGVARTWDVSYAVARAYNRREPLRLILYSADSDYHSGKYFVSSDTGDWNLEGRPKLEVWWADIR